MKILNIKRLILSKNVLKKKLYHNQGWQYGTVRRYGTPQFLRRGTVRWYGTLLFNGTGTVRLFCNGTGTVRWYAV